MVQVHALRARTDIEITLFAARSKTSHYMKPLVISTSAVAADFFQAAYGEDVSDMAARFESYLLAGVKSKFSSTRCCYCPLILFIGVVLNHQQKILQLKKDTANLILECLSEYHL